MKSIIYSLTDNIYNELLRLTTQLSDSVDNYNWLCQLTDNTKQQLGVTQQTLDDAFQFYTNTLEAYHKKIKELFYLLQFYYPHLVRIEPQYDGLIIKREVLVWTNEQINR